MRPLCVGILTSRPSGDAPSSAPTGVEARIDRASAADLACAIRALGHTPEILAVDSGRQVVRHPKIAQVDLCLVAAHGRLGGSGELAAALEGLGIPYCGPSPSATAAAFDKLGARKRLERHALPVPTTVALPPAGGTDVERALGMLGWPCVVKPRRGAHGAGVSFLADRPAIDALLAESAAEERLVERCVDGREIQVVLLGAQVLGAMEVARGVGEDAATMVCPPQIHAVALEGIYALARRAVVALDLSASVTRVDVLCSPRRNECILEVEPLPPLHRGGVVARVAAAAGLRHADLVARILDHMTLPARPTLGDRSSPVPPAV